MPLSMTPIVTPAPFAPLDQAVTAPCCEGPVERLYSLVRNELVGVGVGVTVGVGVGVTVGAGAGAGVEIVPAPPPPPQAATNAAGLSAARMPTNRSWVIAIKFAFNPNELYNFARRDFPGHEWRPGRDPVTHRPAFLSWHRGEACRSRGETIRAPPNPASESDPPMTDHADLAAALEAAWERRDTVTAGGREVVETVEAALNLLDRGAARVAEPDGDGGWRVNQWLKQAVLLSFRLYDNALVPGGAAGAPAFDKVPSKFAGWDEARFREGGFRVVPGAVVRRGSFIGKGAVLMPSFVNIGAYVGEGTMVDTWATVGSCAQIGNGVHLSGGAGIGGVLEPLQAGPVVIGDGAFIGARAEVAEGVEVGEGAVLSMGVYLGASTKIVDRATGEVHIGKVPAYAVVVPGALPGKPLADGSPGPSLYCAVIVKTVDARTRAKTGINELLRD
jgi:2,3,4,5-tetrahydropyridine-2-carboxylate N-succinyltransferase